MEAAATKLVLVVDDDRSVTETTANAVRLAGVRAVGIAIEVDPRDIFFDPQPDLVLIDQMLLGSRDGVELARALRDAGWTCPMMAFSASDQMMQVARDSGEFVSVIPKPYEVYVLVSEVQKALGITPELLP